MMNDCEARIFQTLAELYSGSALEEAKRLLLGELDRWRGAKTRSAQPLTEKDAMLITYGDAISRKGERPLETLDAFLKNYLDDVVTNVHLLPICPYTSDDGFSVSDYEAVHPALGSWEDVERLAGERGVMLDAVVNHTSVSHEWFKRCCRGEEPYRDYYISCNPQADYSSVIRPRTLPLLTSFATNEGEKFYWTTFSADQADVNFRSPALMREIAHVLLTYAAHGARFIRLDAIGFAWKELGTSCMSLPQTHTLVRLLREIVTAVFPNVMLITETNVPHEENIGYFGQGDEAHLVYQFPLPPLTMHALLAGDATRLTDWAQGLERTPPPEGATYFNFLASHDGIGFRPALGLLNEAEQQLLLDATIRHGGRIGMKSTESGGQIPYELNINYMDALTAPDASDDLRLARFMAAQAIMLSMQGMPSIYYHSLLGSRNWTEGVRSSGINRRINREKLDADELAAQLENADGLRARVLREYKRLLRARGACGAFSPYAEQRALRLDQRVFALERYHKQTGERVLALVNVSGEPIVLDAAPQGRDLLSDDHDTRRLRPWQTRWIVRP